MSYTEVMSFDPHIIHVTRLLCVRIGNMNMKPITWGIREAGTSTVSSPSRHEGRLLIGTSVKK